MRKRDCGAQVISIGAAVKRRKAHHARPVRVLEVRFGRATDALRLVQAKEAVVNLARDRVGREEVVEEPLLAQLADVGVEDRERVLQGRWVQLRWPEKEKYEERGRTGRKWSGW